MTKLIIIAGPQSSGKTTTLNLLKEFYPAIPVIPETNQYNVQSKDHPGGVFVGKKLEIKIISKDISVIQRIDRTVHKVIIEDGIFHQLYMEKFGDKTMLEKFYEKYMKACEGLHPIILFIDTKPEISWQRRKKIYAERVKKAGVTVRSEKQKMMEIYRKRIFDLYPLWHKYYNLFPFEKYMIKNSYKSYNTFVEDFMKVFRKLMLIT